MARMRQLSKKVDLTYPVAAFFVLLGLSSGLLYSLLKTPIFTANAYVIVVPTQDNDGPVALNFAQAYGRIARQPDVLAHAAQTPPGTSMTQFQQHVRASTSPDAPLISVSGTARRPAAAAAYANAAATALTNYGNSRQRETGVQIASMSAASLPATPTAPNPPLNIGVGAATGIVLAALAVAGMRRGPAARGRAGRADEDFVPAPGCASGVPRTGNPAGSAAGVQR